VYLQACQYDLGLFYITALAFSFSNCIVLYPLSMSSVFRVILAFAAAQVVLGAPALHSVTKTARCGASFEHLTCQGSSYGDCCSQYGYCGSSAAYCVTGCQSGYGTCSPVTPIAATVSTDGRCGTVDGLTCLGSAFGDCCRYVSLVLLAIIRILIPFSEHGWCGKSTGYCGKGCNPLFGKCSSTKTSPKPSALGKTSTKLSISPSSSPSPIPSPIHVISINARCGRAHGASPAGLTCRGSSFGNCCSQYSYWYVLS
jgi:hypothetical protein